MRESEPEMEEIAWVDKGVAAKAFKQSLKYLAIVYWDLTMCLPLF